MHVNVHVCVCVGVCVYTLDHADSTSSSSAHACTEREREREREREKQRIRQHPCTHAHHTVYESLPASRSAGCVLRLKNLTQVPAVSGGSLFSMVCTV